MPDTPVAPRGMLPAGAEAYRTLGPFDAQTLPSGLRSEHRLKAGTWALVRLSAGSLSFVWDDAKGGRLDLAAPAAMVVPPQVPHHLEGDEPFLVSITFHRAPVNASEGSPG